ncbi:hypothetical protein DTL42_13805 [Bremerella cremea]|uniref:Uncharacterized protein n=1 Tax=Bremerella cremea TaxID=1031537 RepID=A0A368KTX8_9BACT|nr:hypothetical protein [Bremerella cremea]RCS48271.1 hypothetical protein DTL42_13805 [Bremerella cremea]
MDRYSKTRSIFVAVGVVVFAILVDFFSIAYRDRFAGMGTGSIILGMLMLVVVCVVFSVAYLLVVTRCVRNIVISGFIAILPAFVNFSVDAVDAINLASLTPIHLYKRCFSESVPVDVKNFQFVEMEEAPYVLGFQLQFKRNWLPALLKRRGYMELPGEDCSVSDKERISDYVERTPWSNDRIYHKYLDDKSHVVVLTDLECMRCMVIEVSPRIPPRNSSMPKAR